MAVGRLAMVLVELVHFLVGLLTAVLEPMVVGRLVGLEMVLVELEHFLVVVLTLFIVMMISLVVQRRPGVIVQGNVPVPWNFPHLQKLMLCNDAVC